MKKNDKKSKQKILDEIMFSNAGSINDCTGLIPRGTNDREEFFSYEDVRNFSIPEVSKED